MEGTYELPRPERSDEHFAHLMDEIEIMAAALEDVRDGAVAEHITMWIDTMIYRALYAAEEAALDHEPGARECRRRVLEHLDRVAWGVEPAVSGRRASSG